ncbi:LamB/YcsF family protein, partial [Bifidobacterium crudilactis]
AVITDPDRVAERVSRLVSTGDIEAIDGSRIRVSADSVCVHGDSPGAVTMAESIHRRLSADGIRLASFTQR